MYYTGRNDSSTNGDFLLKFYSNFDRASGENVTGNHISSTVRIKWRGQRYSLLKGSEAVGPIHVSPSSSSSLLLTATFHPEARLIFCRQNSIVSRNRPRGRHDNQIYDLRKCCGIWNGGLGRFGDISGLPARLVYFNSLADKRNINRQIRTRTPEQSRKYFNSDFQSTKSLVAESISLPFFTIHPR